ncbi:hypothetical protein J27TS8_16210 [Robertmurraya siralis]|uniref:Cytochrome c oxidase subunit 2A n=1 Tax=Robertmurraya siralis TaxID=77777 RepID=A0A919WGZ9_9BACI|nr:hypothetical protein [Robertmurraya siralis]GIN61628.1 hypothetical protein J27TS8_16210 [Robertmurraya siralis]
MKASDHVQDEINVENENTDKLATSKLGTWISVGVVAAVILVTYFIIFGVYMDRV